MKRPAKKPAVTLRTGTSIDSASAGGPYATKFVKAKVGTLRYWRKGKLRDFKQTGHGIEVHLEEWAPERRSNDIYLSVQSQRAGRGDSFDTLLSPTRLDTLIELLTLVRDKAREGGIIGR